MIDSNQTPDESHSDPLVGDSARRASPTVRGFLYQFWVTVAAWLDLPPEELIYVEGAEDFDIVGAVQSTGFQIKDNRASGPVTLAAPGPLAAISNFWTLRTENRGRNTHFKFITTAASGRERSGFGGDRGVDVWNHCRQAPVEDCAKDIERIRGFITAQLPPDGELSKFLGRATTGELKAELIDRVEWICDQPALDAIVEIVVARLLKKGESRALTTLDAIKLADSLCMRVARAAASHSPTRLDFAELNEHLDDAVNLQIPREALRGMERRNDYLETLFVDAVSTGQAIHTIASSQDMFYPPVQGKDAWPRQALIAEVRGAIDSGFVSIVGGTGFGKTTLVLHSVSGTDNLLWSNLRDRLPPDVVRLCRIIRVRVAAAQKPYVVLDDLNTEGDPRLLEQEIGLLADALRKQGGHLILTSYSQPVPRLRAAAGIQDRQIINVPEFSEGEVESFLRSAGCSDDNAPGLARVVWIHTSGHPQLVAARVVALKSNGFPAPAIDDLLLRPKEILDVQTEARAVVRALPEHARRLLYRLSIALTPLRRSHILGIAACEPPITSAGEIFDTVAGAWFQEVTPGHFRISPLLSKAGEQMFSPAELRQVNADIASCILAERSLTPTEFSVVLTHAIAGEADEILGISASLFLKAPKDVRQKLSERLSLVTAFGVSEGTRLPIKDKTVRRLFRLMQWEIATAVAPQKLGRIATAMETDFAVDSEDTSESLQRIVYLSKIIMQKDLELPVAQVVSHTLELRGLLTLARELDPSITLPVNSSSSWLNPDRPALSELFAVAVLMRVRTIESLKVFVTVLDGLKEEEREWALGGLGPEDGELRRLFSAVWTCITKSAKEAQEEACNSVLVDCIDAGRRWGAAAWMRAAARTRSAILDELLGSPEAAGLALTQIAQEVGWSQNLEHQAAIIAFNHEQYDLAVGIWQRILPGWRSDELVHDIQPIFGLRWAAIASSRLGDWRKAAEFYGQAVNRAKAFDKPGFRIGLPADCGYALWQAGSYTEALDMFTEVARALEALPNSPDNFAEYAVHKLVGHMLSRLVVPTGGSDDYLPGMCSDLSPNREIASLPPFAAVFVWFFLYQLAERTGNTQCQALSAKKMARAPYAVLRATAAAYRLEQALNSDRLDGAIKTAIEYGSEMAKSVGYGNQRKRVVPAALPPRGFPGDDMPQCA